MAAAKAKETTDWDRTANLMAMLATINGGGKTYQPEQFHPFRTTPPEESDIDPRAKFNELKAKEKNGRV